MNFTCPNRRFTCFVPFFVMVNTDCSIDSRVNFLGGIFFKKGLTKEIIYFYVENIYCIVNKDDCNLLKKKYIFYKYVFLFFIGIYIYLEVKIFLN